MRVVGPPRSFLRRVAILHMKSGICLKNTICAIAMAFTLLNFIQSFYFYLKLIMASGVPLLGQPRPTPLGIRIRYEYCKDKLWGRNPKTTGENRHLSFNVGTFFGTNFTQCHFYRFWDENECGSLFNITSWDLVDCFFSLALSFFLSFFPPSPSWKVGNSSLFPAQITAPCASPKMKDERRKLFIGRMRTEEAMTFPGNSSR